MADHGRVVPMMGGDESVCFLDLDRNDGEVHLRLMHAAITKKNGNANTAKAKPATARTPITTISR